MNYYNDLINKKTTEIYLLHIYMKDIKEKYNNNKITFNDRWDKSNLYNSISIRCDATNMKYFNVTKLSTFKIKKYNKTIYKFTTIEYKIDELYGNLSSFLIIMNNLTNMKNKYTCSLKKGGYEVTYGHDVLYEIKNLFYGYYGYRSMGKYINKYNDVINHLNEKFHNLI